MGQHPTVHIQLLGEFRVEIDGRSVGLPTHQRRAGELVKLLAIAPAHRMSREDVVEALWPHLDATAAFANLHKAASQARAALGMKDAIVLSGGSVHLWPEASVRTDAEQFEHDAAQALENGDRERCAAVASSHGAGLLPDDRLTEWATEARDRLRQRHLDLLRRAECWAEVAEVDPTDERAHCALIQELIRSDRRHSAIRQWQRMRDALAEIGVQPGAESRAVWRAMVEGPSAAAVVAPAVSPIVGRDDELRTARRMLARAAEGHGGTLLLGGDPGIGKSRFAETLLDDAIELGWTVLRGSGCRVDGAGPWAPVVESFDRVLRQRPELAGALSESAREGLRRLFGRAAPSPTGAEVRGRQPILLAASQVLEAAAGETGAVLWIDDLHAADEATVQLMHYLARTIRAERVLVVLSYETGALSPSAAQLRTSLLANHGATEIELGPVDPQAAAAIVRTIAVASDATVAAVYRLAEGNPLFTEEIAASIRPDETFAVPRRLREIVQARLVALPPDLYSTLQRLAVAGVQFTADECRPFVDLDQPGLFDMLDAALCAGVLVEAGSGYRFRHQIVRETLQASMAAHHRRAAHQRAADALKASGAPATRIAHHLLAADAAGGEIVPWLEHAAFEAASMGAVADARALADRALGFAPRRSSLLELRANCLFASGEPTCTAAFTDAIQGARGPRRRRLRIRLARAAVVLGDLTTATGALAGLVAATPTERVEMLVAQGYIALAQSDVARAERCAEQARRLAIDEGLATELTGAATLRALVAHSRGDWHQQIEIDLLDTSRAPQLAASVHDGHLCVVEHYLYGSRPYHELIAFAHRLRAAAQHSGADRGFAFATLVLGEAELLAGHHAAAGLHLREAVELHHRVGSAAGQSLALQRCAELDLIAGDGAEAALLLAQALELARQSTLLGRHLLPRIYGTMIDAAAGTAQSLAVVEEAESAVAPTEACRMCRVTFTLPAARACARAGDQNRALDYLAAAREVAPPASRGVAWTAAMAETEAVLAEAAGHATAATSLQRDAAQLYAAAGQTHDASRCRAVACAPAEPVREATAGRDTGAGKVSVRQGS